MKNDPTCRRGHERNSTNAYLKNGTWVCRICRQISSANYKKNNPRQVKAAKERRRLTTQFGISIDTYRLMLEMQNGVCLICQDPPGQRKLAVDHDHETNEVRGLLCHRCNTALGSLKDDPVLLERGIHYLKGQL